mgnify:CR=1 FL=1
MKWKDITTSVLKNAGDIDFRTESGIIEPYQLEIMMTVYIVHYYNWKTGESGILRVFDSKEKAESFASEINHYTRIDEQKVY